ncbi:hypothetical protein KEM55_004230 [Ascosphaera atra]|nr:hypothetical protein KEM55_004230 [Ascosphaera atra]
MGSIYSCDSRQALSQIHSELQLCRADISKLRSELQEQGTLLHVICRQIRLQRLPDPIPYDGSDPELLDHFETCLLAKFRLDGQIFGGEQNMVVYALTRLEGSVAREMTIWFNEKVKKREKLEVNDFLAQLKNVVSGGMF